jgi:hypothetical protein
MKNLFKGLTDDDRALCLQVGARAEDMKPEAFDASSVALDFAATHLNGCPIDFVKVLAFDDFSFLHDVAGIKKNLNRKTGELHRFFLPRCHQ